MPQLEVLAMADCFITQCGMNSVLEALLRGVPMVCLPHFGDQPGIANAVQDLGAGLMIDPLDVGRMLRSAVSEVLFSCTYAQAAAELGCRLARSNGASVAAAVTRFRYVLSSSPYARAVSGMSSENGNPHL